jgi:hypothetical protein
MDSFEQDGVFGTTDLEVAMTKSVVSTLALVALIGGAIYTGNAVHAQSNNLGAGTSLDANGGVLVGSPGAAVGTQGNTSVGAGGSAGASSDMSTETTTRTKQRPTHGSVRGDTDSDVSVGAHVQGGQPRNRAYLPDGAKTNGKASGSSTLN